MDLEVTQIIICVDNIWYAITIYFDSVENESIKSDSIFFLFFNLLSEFTKFILKFGLFILLC